MVQSKGIGSLIKNKLFTGVNPQTIKIILLQNNFLSIKEGDIIFQAGDKSEHLYLIIDGKIKLKIHNALSSSIVREKEKNDFFGQYELLENIPRKSSAVANSDCILYKLSQKDLLDLISKHKAVQDTLSIERNDYNTNIRNSSYQILQTPKERYEDVTLTSTPVPDIELTETQFKERHNVTENTDNYLNNNFEPTTPAAEETIPPKENETAIFDQNENPPQGNIFSAALNGDIAYNDEPDSEGILPFEEKHADNVLNSETAEKKPDVIESLKSEIDYQKLLSAVKKIHENVELDKTIRSIIESIIELFDVQIVRIFLLDKSKNELWSFPFMDNTDEIKKIKIGEGLIGKCAQDNEIINVNNPEQDIRFNYQTDAINNIQVEDMLLYPVDDKEKNVIAIIQLINSCNNRFIKQDEEILSILSSNICNAIETTFKEHDKIEKKSQNYIENMTGFIINDINTPLALIKRYAEFIRNKTDIKEVKQVSEFIIEQVHSVLTYSEIFSDFINRNSSLKRRTMDLQITLGNILDMFAEYVESRNTKLFKKLEANTKIFLDPDIFYHACFQLIKNLCDTMPEGGNIYVISQKEGDIVSIEFHNTGKVIDNKMRSKISNSFIMPGTEENTELSFAIADKIIKDHDGKIRIGSESMGGTSFIISLPLQHVFEK
jgi:signal transduction histidine kinase/CRP-like cAMP-binding protein